MVREGDRNITFFHNITKIVRASNRISKIKNRLEGTLEKPKEILDEVVSYFFAIYNETDQSNIHAQSKIISFIPKFIVDEDNKILNK